MQWAGVTNRHVWTVRRARTADVPAIERLVQAYVGDRRLLEKRPINLYEDVQEFVVAEDADATIIGCGALHVFWEDLAEVRTLAVDPNRRGEGIGPAVLARLVTDARELGVSRLFCLTFEVAFFAAHGFEIIDGVPVSGPVFAEMAQSADEGVAEFLDLERVKPNTLGNTRMLRLV